MSLEKLRNFGAYQKANELFDLVVEDMTPLRRDSETRRLVSQQIASADSICANMEEGAGRWSRSEYAQFLVYSRGSAAETHGRYWRMRHWLPADVVRQRRQLCDEIIGILTSTLKNLKAPE